MNTRTRINMTRINITETFFQKEFTSYTGARHHFTFHLYIRTVVDPFFVCIPFFLLCIYSKAINNYITDLCLDCMLEHFQKLHHTKFKKKKSH